MTEYDNFAVWTLLGAAPLDLTASGTAERLSATDLWVRGVLIQAESGNTGIIRVGDSNVSATFGHEVVAGEAFTLIPPKKDGEDQLINLKDVWFDGDTTGDEIMVSYLRNQ